MPASILLAQRVARGKTHVGERVMRIGLVSYEYPPQRGLGGVGTYTFRLAGALGRAGHDVIVLAGPSEEADLEQHNVTIHRIAARYEPPLGFRGFRWLYWRVFATMMDKAHPLVWHWMRWNMASGDALLDIHRRTPLDVIEAPEHAANALFCGRIPSRPRRTAAHRLRRPPRTLQGPGHISQSLRPRRRQSSARPTPHHRPGSVVPSRILRHCSRSTCPRTRHPQPHHPHRTATTG